MSLNAPLLLVKDRPDRKIALEVLEGLFDLDKLEIVTPQQGGIGLGEVAAAASKTFSPLTRLFTEHTAPELLYLETRWASLVSYDLTAGLLKDVLPVDTRTNAATIRNHRHKVALRQEAELGDGQPSL